MHKQCLMLENTNFKILSFNKIVASINHILHHESNTLQRHSLRTIKHAIDIVSEIGAPQGQEPVLHPRVDDSSIYRSADKIGEPARALAITEEKGPDYIMY